MYSKSFLINVYCTLFSFLLIIGCKPPKESTITVDDKQSLGTYYVDTFSVDLSTVLIDSLPTSGNDKLLVGSYSDPKVGNFSAAAYFQLALQGIDTDHNGREDIVTYTGVPAFDSLVLIMAHTYSYGDTTQPQTMEVHRLTQDLRYASGSANIYNGQSFTYDPASLATVNFMYSRANTTSLRVRLDPALGQEIFDLAYNNDNRVANNDAFKTYFKGLTLRSAGLPNKSIYGYAKTPVVVLYYHDSYNPTIVKAYTFKYTANVDLSYNQIKNDRSATNLASLKNIYQEIPATQTSNESYVMTGIELMTKIKFPYLNVIHSTYANFAVNRAELIIHPKMGSYSQFFSLPNEMVLYKSNTSNIPGAVVTYTGTAIAEIVNPVYDYESNLGTYYKFDVTDFVQSQLKDSYYDQAALILTSPRSFSGNRTEKLVLDNNSNTNTIKLKLYITLF